MIAPGDKRTAVEFKRRTAALTPILQVYIFGSRARGDATVGSDLDVFLVLDHVDADLREKISEIAWEVGFENDVVLSTFVISADELERGPMGVSPIVRQIKREGIQI